METLTSRMYPTLAACNQHTTSPLQAEAHRSRSLQHAAMWKQSSLFALNHLCHTTNPVTFLIHPSIS